MRNVKQQNMTRHKEFWCGVKKRVLSQGCDSLSDFHSEACLKLAGEKMNYISNIIFDVRFGQELRTKVQFQIQFCLKLLPPQSCLQLLHL